MNGHDQAAEGQPETQPTETQPSGEPPNLALVRTDLANERTLLAYGRTSLMIIGTGFSLIQFLKPTLPFLLMGWALIGLGGLLGLVGIRRFAVLHHRLR